MSFTPNYLSQRNPQWANEHLGFDTTVTIGTDGCALTCLTMLVNGFGFNETPSSMNRKLKDLGSGSGFLGSLIVWPGLTRAFPKILFRHIIVCRDAPAPINEINATLDQGQPVLLEIDRSPAPGLQNHWVVVYGRQGIDYLMLDPYALPPDSKPTTLSNRYGFGRDPAEFITAAAWYDAGGNPPSQPAPVPATGLYVRVEAAVTAGLSLRSAPMISALAMASEAPGTLLHCLEPDLVALPKIGVSDQWLQVGDPNGLEGFVAAWYVEKASAGAPAPVQTPDPLPPQGPVPTPPPQPVPPAHPVPVPPAPPASLTVLVSESIGPVGLRLREQPETNANTVTILPAGAALNVIEPTSQAMPKIGQINQWLNVRDGKGYTGYVAAWYVEISASPEPSPQPPPSSGGLTVIVSSQASAGLRLRDQANANANILKVLMPGTALSVLEPDNLAQPKVGVNNQWLNVKEPGGATGFVAAWYVTL